MKLKRKRSTLVYSLVQENKIFRKRQHIKYWAPMSVTKEIFKYLKEKIIIFRVAACYTWLNIK